MRTAQRPGVKENRVEGRSASFSGSGRQDDPQCSGGSFFRRRRKGKAGARDAMEVESPELVKTDTSP